LRFVNGNLLRIGYTTVAASDSAACYYLLPEGRLVSAKKKKAQDETLKEDIITEPVAPDEAAIAEEAELEAAAGEVETIEAEEENPLVVQLEQAEARAAEYLDSLQRERAAFQNYKRRVEREREELTQVSAGRLLVKLLPVLDDFYRAIEAVPDGERDNWFDGAALILRKFERLLQDEGVTEIAALGEPFDPNFHEAVGVDVDTGAESGTITAVMQRGYRHGERVLRPVMVRVAE
jgi:molecular chaperone GrpE